ncbi:transcription factor A, mitochondrial [Microcaecilia unicolor]|uniref:Transcription factor A, mitochondrial n=1 Tax=Microcaecilia unicolor TaxID=1415580 RepID=A0A6P7Y870_9AMPH|nr:transcription factor A, mitochondrial [Microcaecilia unicolor]
MASVLCGRLGAIGKGFGDLLSCRHALRCSSLVSSMENRNRSVMCSEVRWFSKSSSSDNHPKRPSTAYIRYSVEQRPIFKKQSPDLKFGELTRKIALAWNELPVSQKQPYEMAAVADWQIYKEEMARYKAQLTPTQTAALREERRQKLATRKAIKKKRELTMLGKPKRPRFGFNIFMSEHFQEAKGISVQAKMKNLFEDWKQLENSQKQTYMQLAEDDKVRYENEMTAWEEQMIEVGREDLIRVKHRKRLKRQRAANGRKTVKRVVAKRKNANEWEVLGSHKTTLSKTERESVRTKKAEE